MDIAYQATVKGTPSPNLEGMTLEKADKIFDILIKAEVIHSSPFEHIATPVKKHLCIFKDNDYVFADSE